MRDRSFNRKDYVSITAFLQDIKAACGACNIHEGAAVWFFKHYLRGSMEPMIKGRAALPTKTARA